ncbi:MAG: pheromone processing endoprotease [Phylliscum demangeonii]|nr:MAG: pheromone processing endoprotease [Phylliscum demangeonii]
MAFVAFCTWLILIGGAVLADPKVRKDHERYDYYVLHLTSSTPPFEVARSLGLEYESRLGELADHHLFSSVPAQEDVVQDALQELGRRKRKRQVGAESDILNGILLAQKQKARRRLFKRAWIPSSPREARSGPGAQEAPAVDSTIARQREIARSLDIRDPIFNEQWHLFNPAQVGHDINVTGVWSQGVTGRDTVVAIIDDGLDMDSEDLKLNYFAEGSYDFNDHVLEPRPRLADDRHGTRCAGEIAAVKNNVCGVGVAWDAKVAGIRILSKEIDDADEAVAMNYAYQKNLIYSCSWGPPDDGQAMDAPGVLIRRAMVNGVQKGRGGKGSVYVFASGNGAAHDDNCNFDGYTNSIYSITVGAIDRRGLHPYYSEKCSAHLVVTYSSGSGDAIHTTDVGTNKCYSHHGGTSAAAPLAAGIFALVLSVRPELGWRDLQYLAMQTAIPVNEEEADEWQATTIGKKFSHKYGYGKLDAYALVEAARTFPLVKPQAWYDTPWMHVNQSIPQGDQGLASSVEVSTEQLAAANLERLEHVTVTMNLKHARRGDVSVELRSPNGVVSHLSATRKNDKSNAGYQDWTFMSVVHWGESGLGKWSLVVKDTITNDFHGSFTDWKMTLWGECIDPATAQPHPLPTDDDDKEHDATATASASTIHMPGAATPTGAVIAVPTDHPSRPVPQKPSAGGDPSTSMSTSTSTSTRTSTAPSAASGTAATSATSHADRFLPSMFPTFGVSKRTQIWIYGSLAIIVLFCIAIGVYLYLARRRRLRNHVRDDYEFEVLDDQDGAAGPLAGSSSSRRKPARRKGGELYDAFAGESDEELFSGEGEGEKYLDEEGAGRGHGAPEHRSGGAAGSSRRAGSRDGRGASDRQGLLRR